MTGTIGLMQVWAASRQSGRKALPVVRVLVAGNGRRNGADERPAAGARYGGAIAVIAALLLVVIVPLWINSDRIDKTNVRQSEVQALAQRWANDADWSVMGVTATGDQVLIEATGPNPAPGLTSLRHDLTAAGLNGLDVRVSLIPASYQPVPK